MNWIVLLFLSVVIPPGEQDLTDSTAVIQSYLDQGGHVEIPATGYPWIVEPLHLFSNTRLTIHPGVVLQAKEGSFLGPQDSLLNLELVDDVQIIGFGATLSMNREDYTESPYEPAEWRHGVNIRGSSDIFVAGLTVEDSGGDGVYIGPTWDHDRIPCTDVTLYELDLIRNHRQGMTIVSCDRLLVQDLLIKDTAGVAPQAGIDIEPSSYRDLATNLTFRDTFLVDNEGSSVLINLVRLDQRSEPVSITFEDCYLSGGYQQGVRIMYPHDFGASGDIHFARCFVENNFRSGLYADIDLSTDLAISFSQCVWSLVGLLPGNPAFNFRTRGGGGPGFSFWNCLHYEHTSREAWRFDGPAIDRSGVLRVY